MAFWKRVLRSVHPALPALMLGVFLSVALAQTAHKSPKAPKSPRLYIFDCGVIHTSNGDAYSLKKEEMASTEMSIPCILIAHPKGTLMWDNGDIPDRSFPAGGGKASAGVVTQDKPLLPQMAAIGYAPANITYLSMSHYHGDHVANANSFAGSTWLVRKVERDRMFSDVPIPRSDPANYNLLKNSKTVIIDKDEWDVFGDGSVVILNTPGHTPGHHSLLVQLKSMGNVLITGDVTHFQENYANNGVPGFNYHRGDTLASLDRFKTAAANLQATVIIQHDARDVGKLPAWPGFVK